MAKRRTNAEIEEVAIISARTSRTASEITDRVNHGDEDDDATFVDVRAASYWGVKAQYQKAFADQFTVSFQTKDPVVIERVAMAIKAALKGETNG